eukprot:Lithocolla_globosa_v1_NODE_201_length_5225_cov_21.936569.p2 type:complete len:118 gc:universal NODE_201_length_5225_cov_21.936569:158-511(+)
MNLPLRHISLSVHLPPLRVALRSQIPLQLSPQLCLNPFSTVPKESLISIHYHHHYCVHQFGIKSVFSKWNQSQLDAHPSTRKRCKSLSLRQFVSFFAEYVQVSPPNFDERRKEEQSH